MGGNIRFLRKRLGYSQRELAEYLGLKRNNIASYEAGIVEPRAATFIHMSDFFGVKPEVFLTVDFADDPKQVDRLAGQAKAKLSHGDHKSSHQRIHRLERRAIDIEKVVNQLRDYYRTNHHPDPQERNPEIEQLMMMLNGIISDNRNYLEKGHPDHK